ncbi:NAD(P)-binding protein [Abortiporus biennis]|nr:NAD(P)-binding protein [Abortiporus biennis]
MAEFDILVLGATGYTGRLIVSYLQNHPDRKKSLFTFAIAANSKPELSELQTSLNLDDTIQSFTFDADNVDEVEELVARGNVIISAVGPYWRYGTHIVGACVRQGKHYVDLSAETHWLKDIIFHYDYLATKTKSIVVPSCGFESVPSDIAVYLANKTIKKVAGPDTDLENSISAVQCTSGFSRGSWETLMSVVDVPRRKLKLAEEDFALSSLRGVNSHTPKYINKLPLTVPPLYGTFSQRSLTNRAIIQRTWGLHELMTKQHTIPLTEEERLLEYGSRFKYEEFMVSPGKSNSPFSALFLGVLLSFISTAIWYSPFRWLLRMVIPKRGQGPSDKELSEGWFAITNITTSVPTPHKPLTNIRTSIKSQQHIYAASAVFAVESALSILLQHDQLPSLGRQGGVLTPMSALGNVLIQRLKNTGLYTFESEVVESH